MNSHLQFESNVFWLATVVIGGLWLFEVPAQLIEEPISEMPEGVDFAVVARSPDERILIVELPNSGLDRPVYAMLDPRNEGQLLPFPWYVLPPSNEDVPDTFSIIQWFWNDTAIRVVNYEGRDTSVNALVLRKDVRSGIYCFQEPSLPSKEDLVSLLSNHSDENPEVFHGITYPNEDGDDLQAQVLITDHIWMDRANEGVFAMVIRIGGYRWSVADYRVVLYTPDWLRYDLLQITRYTDLDVPGDPFVEPDAKDVLLYQSPDLPEDLRWKPVYDSSISLGGSKDLSQEGEKGEQSDEWETE